MVYLGTVVLAVGLIAGLLGMYGLGFNMVLGFYLFWAFAIVGIAFISLDKKRRQDFL